MKIDDKILLDGLNKTLENARLLFIDATLLLENKKYPRAYTLYQLSIEEIGKLLILHNSLLDYHMGNEVDRDYLHKHGYFNHVKKTHSSITLEFSYLMEYKMSVPTASTGELIKDLINEENNLQQSNELKNSSLYVDFSDNKFKSPIETITLDMVTAIESKARLRILLGEKIYEKSENSEQLIKEAKRLKEVLDDPELSQQMERKLAEILQ